MAIWLNSTLGLIIRTGYAQTTQRGRATLRIKAVGGLPMPDFNARTKAGAHARRTALNESDRLSNLMLEPAAYAWRDPGRHAIDEVMLDMLGIASPKSNEALTSIRRRWCEEPIAHGGNKAIIGALQ